MGVKKNVGWKDEVLSREEGPRDGGEGAVGRDTRAGRNKWA